MRRATFGLAHSDDGIFQPRILGTHLPNVGILSRLLRESTDEKRLAKAAKAPGSNAPAAAA